MKKVSVIVPVYNTQPYLKKCLDSLVQQTLDEIEVIVVNDGTLDQSQMIIDEFAQNYPDIIVPVIQVNQGLSAARNTGISIASGEFIGFVDSDDWVDHDMFRLMYEKAKKISADLVVCDSWFVYLDKSICVKSGINDDATNQEDVLPLMKTMFPAAWNKLYRRSLFDRPLRFKQGVWFEDVEFMHRLFPILQCVGVVHQPLIHYLQREGAITKTFNFKLFDYLENWEGIIEYYHINQYYEKAKFELEYSCVRYVLGTFLKNSLKLESKDMFEKALNEAFALIEKHFPNYRKNKYFVNQGLKGFQLLLINKPFMKALRRINRVKNYHIL